jgi:histidine phosphotransferase ChpT
MITDATSPPLHTLIASRICHDVIGPVGAIGNGVELMEVLGDTVAPEDVALVSDSARAAQSRIEFLRVAFGRPSGRGTMTPDRMAQLLTPIFQSSRVTLSLNVRVNGPASETVRDIALGLMCAEKALPRGGTLTVSERGTSVVLTANGEPCALSDRLMAILQSSDLAAQEPNEVEFELLRRSVAEMGQRLSVKVGPGQLELDISRA